MALNKKPNQFVGEIQVMIDKDPSNSWSQQVMIDKDPSNF